MIYIFKAFQSICSLPGTLCSYCGEACKQCPGLCSGCGRACASVGAEVKHFMERPLSAYVVVSVAISALTLYSCSQDMAPGCTSNFLYILMAFSVVNIIFALYLQCRVWSQIMSEENQEKFIDGDRPTQPYTGEIGRAAVGMFGRAKSSIEKEGLQVPAVPANEHGTQMGKIIVPSQVVQDSFKKIFYEDFGVLAMFFLLLGVFFLSWQGQDYVDTAFPKCNVSSMTQNCGFLFFWVAFLWCMMYMCCRCCSNKVTIDKPRPEDVNSIAE